MKFGHLKYLFGRYDEAKKAEYKKSKDLKKQQQFDMYMNSCSVFESGVQSAIDQMDQREEFIEIARDWFLVRQAFLRSTWNTVLQEEEADLENILPYLLETKPYELVYNILTDGAKLRVMMWQYLANYITVQLFRYRLGKLSFWKRRKLNSLLDRKLRRLCRLN